MIPCNIPKKCIAVYRTRLFSDKPDYDLPGTDRSVENFAPRFAGRRN